MSSNDLKLAKINELKTQIELLEKQLCKKLKSSKEYIHLKYC